MPYPTKLLNSNEDVALDLRPHWWYFGRQILTAIPLVVVIALIAVWSPGGGFFGAIRTGAKWIIVALVVAWVVWLALKFAAWMRTYFVVTNQRVIYRTGVISRHGVEMPLERITNINFRQRIFDRIIGAGNLDIESAGEQGSTTFDFVRHPDGVQQEVYKQMDARSHQQATLGADAVGDAVAKVIAEQGGAAPGQTVPEQIEALARLRDAGHITPEEFEAKKAELLGRM
ncbi:MAG: PH domain-containing protein [Actinomycetota bacterium]